MWLERYHIYLEKRWHIFHNHSQTIRQCNPPSEFENDQRIDLEKEYFGGPWSLQFET